MQKGVNKFMAADSAYAFWLSFRSIVPQTSNFLFRGLNFPLDGLRCAKYRPSFN